MKGPVTNIQGIVNLEEFICLLIFHVFWIAIFSYPVVSVKPDPDGSFQQRVGGSPHVGKSYGTDSRAYIQRSNWSSASHSFHEESQHQTPRLVDTSLGWPIGRQRFSDSRDVAVAPSLKDDYRASRPPPVLEEYSQQHGGSPGVDPCREPWGMQDDGGHQSHESPPTLAPATLNSDPYRTASGHHHAAESGAFRPETCQDGGDDEGVLYRPRKLLADFYRLGERQDHCQRQNQQEQDEETVKDVGAGRRLMGETGRWVKAASAYDGSPPVEQQQSEETASFFLQGRRQTWPLGTSVVPAVRRRQLPQTDDQYCVDEDVEQMDRDPRPSAAVATGAVSSPISRLIQRYEYDNHAMTSASSNAGPTSAYHTPSSTGGRADWFSLPWQPSISSVTAVDNSVSSAMENLTSVFDYGDGTKTYSCHICSYIGQ